MSQVLIWGDAVAYHLFKFFDVGEAALLGARPDELAINVDFEDAAGPWLEGESGDFLFEGGQQFLCHPGGAK